MRNLVWSLALLSVLAACSKSDEKAPAKDEPAVKKEPPTNEPPVLVGEPPAQDADFPKEQWVRTTTFNGEPFLGFTYVDRSKGNSIKGELTEGVAPAELTKKLQGFPGYTLQPIPAGHAVEPLTPEEVKELGLPTPPDWLSHYQ